MEFRILGPLVLIRDGIEVPVGAAKQRALLVLLLLRRGELVPTESLVEDLWPDRAPATAVKTVQVYISQLRKVVGEGVLETRPAGYVIHVDPDGLDAVRFERLLEEGRRLLASGEARLAREVVREALGLWRGPALAEFRYDAFARDEIARLEGLRLVAIETRLEADLALGRHAEAVPEVEALVREYPLRESLRRLLMLALYRAGRQADALAAYQDARTTLVEELGIEPGEPIRQLEAAILRQDGALDLAGRVEGAERAEPPLEASAPGAAGDRGLPTGTVTMLFTDIEGSTRLLKQLGERYGELLSVHRRLLRTAFAANGGREMDTQGDAFFVAFPRARNAVEAAIEAQRKLAAHEWMAGVDCRVRMGLHTGEPSVGEEGYHGIGLHRGARIAAAAHGGQILLSNSTRELIEDELPAGVTLRDLGERQLKDIDRPERIYQLVVDGLQSEFPPVRAQPATAGRSRSSLRWKAVSGALLAAVLAAVIVLLVGLGRSSSALAQIDANSVGAINTGSDRFVEQVRVGSGPGRAASGGGSIWVANVFDDSVSRVDPATSSVQDVIPVDLDPTALAFGQGSLWVACSGTRKLLWINPGTDRILESIPVGNGPSGVALSPGAVWVTNRLDDTVTEIDSTTGRVERTFDAGPSPSDLAYGLGAIWITNESSSTVTRLDPRTGGAETISVGNGPDGVAVGAGAVWVANGLDGTVSRIDPTSDTVVSAIPVGLGPSSVLVEGGVVWVAASYASEISRIDAGSNRVVKTIPVGNGPQSLAGADGRVWVTTRGASAVHRGGTLRVDVSADLIDSLDPALSDAPQSGAIVSMVGDGLVGIKRVSGLDGGTLVPDLATSIPAPTDGGRTYTFQLRSGIRYSNGVPVRAGDLRRGLERDFRVGSPSAGYYGGIVGAAACSRKRCDLSRGVVADDGAGTVTIHLRAPDPEFLYKLTVPSGRPVPPVPMKPRGRLGVPGTGPYMVASHGPKQIVLVRNPYFREWSAAAQPDGYPDRIVWNLAGSPGQQLTAVEQGKADYDPLTELTWRDELATRYSAQVHIFPTPATFALFLNTRVAPFDNQAARQALNYAIDRRKAAAGFGTEGAVVTCQILPVGSPGYEPQCLYTNHPGSVWSAPDLALARKLVASSGTKGEKVVVWTVAHPSPLAIGRLAVATLEELGYRASLKLFASPSPYFSAIYNPRNRAQVGFVGWGSDYPAASNFLSLFTCQDAAGGNASATQLCNRGLDRAIDSALNAQSVDSPSTSTSWAQVDRRVSVLAPWVPLVNPRAVVVVSRRVGNVQYNPQWGTLIDQLWVR